MTEQASRPQASGRVYDEPGGDAYVVEVPVGHVRADQIGVEATVDTVTVTVSAESRVMEFPMDLDTDRVAAELKDGILRIRAPKAAAAPRRRVPVEQVA